MDCELSWEVKEYGHRCKLLRTRRDGKRCKLLRTRRDGKNANFHVISTIVDDEGATTTLSRKDAPRNATKFFDLPYTTDMHLDTVFRHELEIPEDKFPNAWRDESGRVRGEWRKLNSRRCDGVVECRLFM
jgi:hypothetical protein